MLDRAEAQASLRAARAEQFLQERRHQTAAIPGGGDGPPSPAAVPWSLLGGTVREGLHENHPSFASTSVCSKAGICLLIACDPLLASIVNDRFVGHGFIEIGAKECVCPDDRRTDFGPAITRVTKQF